MGLHSLAEPASVSKHFIHGTMAPELKGILRHYPEISGIHPAADIFPMLPEQEFLELCADIKERGLQQPITIWKDGTLLDGRNRLLACYETHQEVVLDRYEGSDPVQFSLSSNLHRRHLNQGQKAMVALKVEEIFAAEARDRQLATLKQNRPVAPVVANLPQRIETLNAAIAGAASTSEQKPSPPQPNTPPAIGSGLTTTGQRAVAALGVAEAIKEDRAVAAKSRDQAAAVVGASGRSVQMAKAVSKAAPDLAEKVERGQMPLHRAYRETQERQLREPLPEEVKWSDDEMKRRKIVEAGGTVVANMHSGKDEYLLRWARSTDRFVRIDRQSDWGNPFEMPADGDRDTVCDSYEVFFPRKFSLHNRLDELKGKVLGCWCYPQRCHGDYLVGKVTEDDF